MRKPLVLDEALAQYVPSLGELPMLCEENLETSHAPSHRRGDRFRGPLLGQECQQPGVLRLGLLQRLALARGSAGFRRGPRSVEI